MSSKSNSKIIGVLSGKGGVGKTTIVSNLGAALASDFGKKVLIIDSNVKTSHLGLHLGLYEELPVTLREVMFKKVPVMYAIFLHPTTGLRLLPAPMKADMNLRNMDGIFEELRGAYDPILVDCAPGLGRDVVIAAKAIDKAILVTTPDLPAVTDVLKTIGLLEKFKKNIIGIVINRVRKEKYELTLDEIESTCGYDVVSIIPETNKIPESISEGVPLVMSSGCQAAVELKRLAANLIGEEYQPGGLWDRLKHLFKIPLNTISRKPKASFVRESDMDRREDGITKNKIERKKKLIKEKTGEEELAVVEELREDLKRDLDKKKSKEAEEASATGVEKEIMERVKEKLRKRLGR